jgi:hypothetical protein
MYSTACQVLLSGVSGWLANGLRTICNATTGKAYLCTDFVPSLHVGVVESPGPLMEWEGGAVAAGSDVGQVEVEDADRGWGAAEAAPSCCWVWGGGCHRVLPQAVVWRWSGCGGW